MPFADTLIMRNAGNSQVPSIDQVWVISSQAGQTYNIGFFKEFVKKHLFVDPEMNNVNVKATHIVGKANRYGNLQGNNMIGVPNNLDLPTMRFLKLKKLVYSRMAQGKCSVCHYTEGQHEKLCNFCHHTHTKAFDGGGPCGKPVQGGGTCTCPNWVKDQVHLGQGVQAIQNCAGFVANEYELDRSNAGKENPFGGAGGQCTGTNSAALMSAIDLTTFKDAVVNAVHAIVTGPGGWPNNQKKVGVPLIFGPGTVVTVQHTDDYTTFSNRAVARGMQVDINNFNGTYQIYHFRALIP